MDKIYNIFSLTRNTNYFFKTILLFIYLFLENVFFFFFWLLAIIEFFFFGGGGGGGLFTVGQTTELNPAINFNDLPPAGCWLVVWLQFGSFSSLIWLVQLIIFSPPSPNRTVPNPIFDLRYPIFGVGTGFVKD